MKHLCTLILLGGFATSTWAQSKVHTAIADTTVYGIRLGEPLAMPECKRTKISDSYYYDGTDASLCYTRLILPWDQKKFAEPVTTEIVFLFFPLDKKPLIARPTGVSAQIISGKVESITILTHGNLDQDVALATLREKYGEPTTVVPETLQNSLGASFTTTLATWKFDNLNVSFYGIFDASDKGRLQISTNKGTEFSSASKEPKGPKL